MRAASTLCKILMWITAVMALLFQCMAMWGIHINNSGLISLGKPEDQYNMVPLILATVGLAVAVALFSFLPQRLRFIGLILMGIVAVAFIPLALDLSRQFPPYVSSGGEDRGLTTWSMIYRHMLPVATAVFALVAWICDRALDRQLQLRLREEAKKEHFDLSGDPLFSDKDKKEETPSGSQAGKAVKKSRGNKAGGKGSRREQ